MPAARARAASAGPASTSASTLTMTTCFFAVDRRERMRDAGDGIAGRLHHHLDVIARDRFGDVRRDAHGRDARRIPAEAGEPSRDASGRRSAIAADRDAGHVRHLRQEHGPEFSRADQRDADRAGLLGAAQREIVQVHARFFPAAAFRACEGDAPAIGSAAVFTEPAHPERFMGFLADSLSRVKPSATHRGDAEGARAERGGPRASSDLAPASRTSTRPTTSRRRRSPPSAAARRSIRRSPASRRCARRSRKNSSARTGSTTSPSR